MCAVYVSIKKLGPCTIKVSLLPRFFTLILKELYYCMLAQSLFINSNINNQGSKISMWKWNCFLPQAKCGMSWPYVAFWNGLGWTLFYILKKKIWSIFFHRSQFTCITETFCVSKYFPIRPCHCNPDNFHVKGYKDPSVILCWKMISETGLKGTEFPHFSANGHIMLNAPVLVRSLKLSSIEPC